MVQKITRMRPAIVFMGIVMTGCAGVASPPVPIKTTIALPTFTPTKSVNYFSPLPTVTWTPKHQVREIPTAKSTPTIEISPTSTPFLLPSKFIGGKGVITALWYRDPETDDPIEVAGAFDLDHGTTDSGTPDDIIVSTTCASMCFDEWAAIHGAKYIWFDDETTSVDLCVRNIPLMTTESMGWPLRSSICVLTNQGNISLLSDFHIYEVPNGESWNFQYQTWLSNE